MCPAEVIGWVAAGGLLYTAGVWFLLRDDRVPYYHAIWHLLVIAARLATTTRCCA